MESTTNIDVLNDQRSVLLGGTLVGWTADVAVVLWKRILGSLGDINAISDPFIHFEVLKYLSELMTVLLKVSYFSREIQI